MSPRPHRPGKTGLGKKAGSLGESVRLWVYLRSSGWKPKSSCSDVLLPRGRSELCRSRTLPAWRGPARRSASSGKSPISPRFRRTTREDRNSARRKGRRSGLRSRRRPTPFGQACGAVRLGPWDRPQRSFCRSGEAVPVDLGLTQVEVREGDAYNTGLPRGSFDGGHMRLVLVNVPKPESIVRELVSLVRPGGWVASCEADLAAVHSIRRRQSAIAYSPPTARCHSQSIDLFVGRRTHRMFREAGLTDIDVEVSVRVHPLGHSRRPIFRDFINNVRDKLIDGGLRRARTKFESL